MEEHFADWHQVADYAGALGYDRRTLARATRAATGVGAKQFLDQRILLEAKRLLAHTDLPVGGCARALGFRDAANFTTFFQRGAGMPPSVWRADPAEGGTARPAPNGSKADLAHDDRLHDLRFSPTSAGGVRRYASGSRRPTASCRQNGSA